MNDKRMALCPISFWGQTGANGCIQSLFEPASGSVHRLAQHSFDVFVEGDGRPHGGIMMLQEVAVKMLGLSGRRRGASPSCGMMRMNQAIHF